MKKNLISSTIILTISTVLIRFIGFAFRIYLANTIGAEGMGLYQLILSFYILMVTLATSGITAAVSRLTAEEIALGRKQNVKQMLKTSLFICIVFSSIAATIQSFGAYSVSKYIIKDLRAIYPLLYLAPSLPFLAFSACFRGYYFALRKVGRTSSAQLLEQIIRIFVTMALLSTINKKSIAAACSAATIGMTAGEIASLIYILFLYLNDSKKTHYNKKPDKMLPKIIHISMPVAGSSYLNSFLRMTENSLIPIKLVASGMTYTSAISFYGMIKGMVLPVLFFPTSFLTSLAIMLLPTISGANAVKNDREIEKIISLVLHFTMICGLLIVSIFSTFSYNIGVLLYNNQEVGIYLKILSFMCPFMYTNMIVANMLNALGEELRTFKINIIESIIKIFSIVIFVPYFGLSAYLFALFFTTALNSIMYIYRLLKVSTIIFDVTNWITKPILAAVFSSVLANLFYRFILNFCSGVTLLLLSIFFLISIYIILIIVFKSIPKKELNILLNTIKLKAIKLRQN